MSVEITNVYSFEPSKLIFSEPKDEQIPGSTVKNKRIQISVRYPSNKVGPLIITTLDNCFSMGIKDNIFQEKFTGLSLPIFLNQKEASEERKKDEMKWINNVENIIKAIVSYILSIKTSLGKHEYLENSFSKTIYKKLDPKGVPIPGTYSISPKIEFTKVRPSKDSPNFTVGKITTLFYTPSGVSLNPFEFKDKFCNVQAALKIESILMGRTASISVKVYNVIVHPSNNNAPPVPLMTFIPQTVEVCTSNNPLEGNDEVSTQTPGDNDIEDPETEKVSEKVLEKPRNVKKVVKKTK